jgi:16S rRNA (guanine966-N2)-methyltransferase
LGNQNRLRIIGGQWRGRKLDFPDVEGLRPTPDRVRETLFNWLQGHVVDAHCLDLFAGSGALGLEAVSRGAARAVLVDSNAAAIQQLEKNLRTLKCDIGVVSPLSASDFLQRGPGGAHYELVFLDPPFGKGLIQDSIDLLEKHQWLTTGAHVYFEMESTLPVPELPQHWQLIREQTAGQVHYGLIRVE